MVVENARKKNPYKVVHFPHNEFKNTTSMTSTHNHDFYHGLSTDETANDLAGNENDGNTE